MKAGIALLFMMILLAAAARAGTVSGVVRDEEGTPIPGAKVILGNGNNDSADSIATTTDVQGKYHFIAVPDGAYNLQASLSGFADGEPVSISVSVASPDVIMDRTLGRPRPRPQFEAAGIRGLIDPGGYSASADAAAASGVMSGIANIERTGNARSTQDKADTPCSLEPELKKAVEEQPERVEPSLRLADFYLGHGHAAKAIPILEHARSLDLVDQRVFGRLAEAYLEAGRFDSAETLLTPLAAGHGGPEELRWRARAREGKGNFIGAASDYQAAADQEPSEENLFGIGYELILAGRPKEAEQAFQAGLQRHSQSAELLIGLGAAQFLEGHAAESIHTLLRAAEINPSDARPYSFLAKASAVSRDETGQVSQAFGRFLSLAPNNAEASYDSALDLLQQPERNGANEAKIESLLKHAIFLDPGMAAAHFELGVLYGNRHAYQLASPELETAVRLSPQLEEAHYRLALAYRETGHEKLSRQEMHRFEDLRRTSSGVNIDQFISVFAPSHTSLRSEKLCPGELP